MEVVEVVTEGARSAGRIVSSAGCPGGRAAEAACGAEAPPAASGGLTVATASATPGGLVVDAAVGVEAGSSVRAFFSAGAASAAAVVDG